MQSNHETDENVAKANALFVWLVSLAMVCCIGLIIALFMPKIIAQELFWIAKAQDVENHKQLWNKHRITKYEIGVNFATEYLSYPGGTGFECSQELLVDHNTIIQTTLNTCDRKFSLTVDHLFSLIAEKVSSRHCNPEGCHCGPLVVDVTYDSQYYFPKKAKTFYDFASGEIFKMTEDSYCMGMGGNATQGITLDTYFFKPVP